MASTSNEGRVIEPALTEETTRESTTTRQRTRTTGRTRGATTTTSTEPKTRGEQVQSLAERAVLVPVGAGLLARDNLVSTAKGLATRYTTRAGFERELKRYERRGVTARNRAERRVRRTRTRVERAVKQNRRQFERQVRNVRKDFEKQSGIVGARVDKLVANAQGLISSTS